MAPPPGYVAYGGAGAAMEARFRPVKSIATAAVALQLVALAGSVVLLVLQLGLRDEARQFLDDTLTKQGFEDATGAYGSLALIAGALSLGVLVIMVLWSFRIAANLRAAGRAPLTWKPGLTVLVWILGGCTLNIINFLLLREHWRGSDPDTSLGDPNWKRSPVDPLITAWFVAGLVGIGTTFASVGAGGVFTGTATLDSTTNLAKQIAEQSNIAMLTTVLGAVSTVLLVLVVRRLTARHMRLTHEA